MRLYHPDLDRWHDFGSERSARIARKSGWQDRQEVEAQSIDDHEPDVYAGVELETSED